MKRVVPKPTRPSSWKRYVCGGCGYEYDPAIGDEENEIPEGTLFENYQKNGFVQIVEKRKLLLLR